MFCWLVIVWGFMWGMLTTGLAMAIPEAAMAAANPVGFFFLLPSEPILLGVLFLLGVCGGLPPA
jgi:hypothetical protein